ncbi:hypothetical protein [Coleofasciculus sp. H7-2]|uniref:hypothetical protein n=1 Tax=Coleofasciculus sp. H7-2 TaxID=3351545 RepID=UPI003672AC32
MRVKSSTEVAAQQTKPVGSRLGVLRLLPTGFGSPTHKSVWEYIVPAGMVVFVATVTMKIDDVVEGFYEPTVSRNSETG